MGNHVLSLQKLAPSGESKNATVLWVVKEAKDRGVAYYDMSHKKEIQIRAEFRLNFSTIHLKKNKSCLGKNTFGMSGSG